MVIVLTVKGVMRAPDVLGVKPEGLAENEPAMGNGLAELTGQTCVCNVPHW